MRYEPKPVELVLQEPHLLPGVGNIMGNFEYYFAQREAIETYSLPLRCGGGEKQV